MYGTMNHGNALHAAAARASARRDVVTAARAAQILGRMLRNTARAARLHHELAGSEVRSIVLVENRKQPTVAQYA
jgi:hypothetical protein